jgi:hypothetical protein
LPSKVHKNCSVLGHHNAIYEASPLNNALHAFSDVHVLPAGGWRMGSLNFGCSSSTQQQSILTGGLQQLAPINIQSVRGGASSSFWGSSNSPTMSPMLGCSLPLDISITLQVLPKSGSTTFGFVYLDARKHHHQAPITIYFHSAGQEVYTFACPDFNTFLQSNFLCVHNVLFVGDIPWYAILIGCCFLQDTLRTPHPSNSGSWTHLYWYPLLGSSLHTKTQLPLGFVAQVLTQAYHPNARIQRVSTQQPDPCSQKIQGCLLPVHSPWGAAPIRASVASPTSQPATLLTWEGHHIHCFGKKPHWLWGEIQVTLDLGACWYLYTAKFSWCSGHYQSYGLLIMGIEFCWVFCSSQVSWLLGSQVRIQLG